MNNKKVLWYSSISYLILTILIFIIGFQMGITGSQDESVLNLFALLAWITSMILAIYGYKVSKER